MKIARPSPLLAALGVVASAAYLPSTFANDWNTSYINPVLPGWHSDPSCIFVKELDGTTFCTTSSFLEFPGASIYASKDLVNWRLACNVFNRQEQVPGALTANVGSNLETGILASTLRQHDGKYYLITTWLDSFGGRTRIELRIFIGTDPNDETTWSDSILIPNIGAAIDPDVFWDDDGRMIVTVGASVITKGPIQAYYVELDEVAGTARNTSQVIPLWEGTGGSDVEGPHLYRKDGYYYLLVAEGGTGLRHAATMARSKSLEGPWESNPANPLISNKGTNEYYQSVGHADLFQDANGQWWGMGHTTRGGPDLYRAGIVPLGREAVLFPVSWPEGEFPSAPPLRGYMQAPLPLATLNVTGQGTTFISASEAVDFEPGQSLPRDWKYVRAPRRPEDFTVSPPGHFGQLRLTGSASNLTGSTTVNATSGITLITRLQTSTLFDFSFDLSHDFGSAEGDEAGLTSFKYNDKHVDLGIVNMKQDNGTIGKFIRARATFLDLATTTIPDSDVLIDTVLPDDVVLPVPERWTNDLVRLRLSSVNATHFEFSAGPASRPSEERSILVFSSTLVTGSGIDSGKRRAHRLSCRAMFPHCSPIFLPSGQVT
jgi:beta-xylosidase